jgi:ABC-type nitrate/sulfonate/bicarbonate transport system permease component
MSTIYEAIGRLVVSRALSRFGPGLRIGGGVALVALLVGGYLAASRKVEEG